MLQNPADFATAVDALFDTQKQAMAAGESFHFLFFGNLIFVRYDIQKCNVKSLI